MTRLGQKPSSREIGCSFEPLAKVTEGSKLCDSVELDINYSAQCRADRLSSSSEVRVDW